MNILRVPHKKGVNNIQYVLLNETTIQTISDYELDDYDMVHIEKLLGVDIRLGKRFTPNVEVDKFGQLITTWDFLLPGDCDWR